MELANKPGPMKWGLYISGAGHGGLILWMLLGGLFSAPRPEPLDVAPVSLVSAEEFAALTAEASAPRAKAKAARAAGGDPEATGARAKAKAARRGARLKFQATGG